MLAKTPKPIRPIADPDVLAAAERFVADVRSGNIKAFAVAFVTDAKPFTGSRSGIARDDDLSAKLLEAACHELDHVWMHVVDRGQ